MILFIPLTCCCAEVCAPAAGGRGGGLMWDFLVFNLAAALPTLGTTVLKSKLQGGATLTAFIDDISNTGGRFEKLSAPFLHDKHKPLKRKTFQPSKIIPDGASKVCKMR